MYDEIDLLPLSALQHLVFCERQCALIHIDRAWEENLLTAQGRSLHDRTHEAEDEARGDLRIARALRLRSLELGVVGVADVVEFHLMATEAEESPRPPKPKNGVSRDPPRRKDDARETSESKADATGVHLPGAAGLWRPFPVEYKRGKPKRNNCDRVQLCAQAVCLEEMLGVRIDSGALFYGKTRRRHDVQFDDALRRETRDAARRLHALVDSGRAPAARYEKKCDSCSLAGVCLPRVAARGRGARAYLDRAVRSLGEDYD